MPNTRIELTAYDFIALAKLSVQMAASNARTCLQVKTFRFLQKERGAEVGTPNLGAVPTDKDTPFFWSAKWHKAKYNPNDLGFDYPILTMYETHSESTRAFDNDRKKCYHFELAVLDVYKEDACKKLSDPLIDCSARPINQIYFDTEAVLEGVLKFMSRSVIATTSLDASTPRLYYEPHLEAIKAVDAGYDYEVLADIGKKLKEQNPNTRFLRVERPTQNIYGTKCHIVFCTHNCPQTTYNDNLPDYGIVPHEVGCKNC